MTSVVSRHVRSGAREDLVATLRRFEADRGERGENERAADARHAAELLEGGEEVAYFERVFYTVDDADRWSIQRGDRATLISEIRDFAAGWEHMGKPKRAAELRAAAAELEAGADVVRVEWFLYDVTD